MGDREVRAERQVLVDGLQSGLARILRASELHRPALEAHRAGIGADGAGDDLDQGRLAGAVIAEQADDLALADAERRLLERGERAVGFSRPGDGEGGLCLLRRARRSRGGVAEHGGRSRGIGRAQGGGRGSGAAQPQRRGGLVGDQRQQQHAADGDRLPPRLQTHKDQPGIENADGGDADGDAERPAGAARKGDAAEDRRRQHVEFEAGADGGGDAAEPSGDQHRDQPDQQPVHGIEPDDHPAHRHAAELGGTRIAADGVDAQARDGAGEDEGADDEHGDSDQHGVLHAEQLAAAEFEERLGEAVDGGAADHEGEAAIKRQHGEGDDQRRDGEPAHQDAVDQPEQEPEAQPGSGGEGRVLRRHGDLGDDDADQRHHTADRQVDIAGDQQGRGAENGDQHRGGVDPDDDEILGGEERGVQQRKQHDKRHCHQGEPDAARRFARRAGAGQEGGKPVRLRCHRQPLRAEIVRGHAVIARLQKAGQPGLRQTGRRNVRWGAREVGAEAYSFASDDQGKFTYWSRVS